MIDPNKFDDMFKGITPGIEDVMTNIEILLARTERYDEMFPWFDKEVCEKLASLDQFYLRKMLSILQDPATKEILEKTYRHC